jgi:hypothetical protein
MPTSSTPTCSRSSNRRPGRDTPKDLSLRGAKHREDAHQTWREDGHRHSSRQRNGQGFCFLLPLTLRDICSPVVQAEKREATERARNIIFMGYSVYQNQREPGKAKSCASLGQTEIPRHRPMIRCVRASDGRLRRRYAPREYEIKGRIRKAVSSWVGYSLR